MSDEEHVEPSEPAADAAEPRTPAVVEEAGQGDGGTTPAPPPPPSGGPPTSGEPPTPSGWSRPSTLPISTILLGAFLIGALAFGFGVFAGRSSADGIGRSDRADWMHRGQGEMPGSMVPGAGGNGGFAPGMPGVTLPGGGAVPGFPGQIGDGAGGATTGRWAVTAGTVTRVDGDTIVVQSVRGNTVTVTTTDATSIRIVRDQGEAGDRVAAGDEIVVAGTPGDEDLTIEAVRIVAGDLPWIRTIGGAGSSGGVGSSGGAGSSDATVAN
jgi:hypothetical protein